MADINKKSVDCFPFAEGGLFGPENRPTRTCGHCGKSFPADPPGRGGRPKLFCSDECRVAQSRAQQRRWVEANRAPAKQGRKRRETGTAGAGNEQSQAPLLPASALATAARAGKLTSPDCRHCGRKFAAVRLGRGRPSPFCSASCRREHGRELKRAANKRRRRNEVSAFDLPRPLLTATCKHCGAEFQYELRTKHRAFCSSRCRRADFLGAPKPVAGPEAVQQQVLDFFAGDATGGTSANVIGADGVRTASGSQ